MVKTPVFKGSCTAMVTPFTQEGIDFQALERNIDYQYENGSAAILVCGTTGEAATMSTEEKQELLRQAVKFNAGRMKLICGIGSNDTRQALKAAESAKSAGADAVLMVTPYYNKTTQAGLIEHFTYVADRVDIPMIVYNVPSRTGIGITAQTYKALSQHPNIVGTKEASGDISLAAQTRSLCGDDLYLWSGNDDNTLAMMALGALGVISVASNIVPGAVAKLCSLCLEGDYAQAQTLNARYAPLFSALFTETNPIPVKAAMKLLGFDCGPLRLPLTQISQGAQAKLTAVMRDLGLNV